MTLSELLAQYRARKTELAAAMQTQLEGTVTEQGARALTEAEQTAHDGWAAELAGVERQIANIETAMRAQAATAAPIADQRRAPAPTIVRKDPDDKWQGQSFVRMVIARLESQRNPDAGGPAVIAHQRWGKSHPNLVKWIQATVGGGGLGLEGTNPAWGEELVQYDTRARNDFIEFLYSRTIFDRIGFRQVPTDILIKGQDGAATGYWVGQGKGIPVSALDFLSVQLTTLKVAGLTVISEEWLRRADPSGELLVRDALVEALRQVVDTTAFGDDAAVPTVSPAGLLAGVAPIATAGAGIAGARADIFALINAFISEKNEEGLAWVMNPGLALQLASLRNEFDVRAFPAISATGGTLEGYPVFTGHNVEAGRLILAKPGDVYRIDDPSIEVALSREATIEMSDSPAGEIITPTSIALAQVPVNMFQTHAVAIKAVRSVNFAKRRSGAVKHVESALYYPESA
jgi:hypothetical protein